MSIAPDAGAIADGMFQLWVSNDGVPISSEGMARLFKPFARGKVQTSQQGLGLGLYIASEIARAHSGTLEAISNLKETRFTLTIPNPERPALPAAARQLADSPQ